MSKLVFIIRCVYVRTGYYGLLEHDKFDRVERRKPAMSGLVPPPARPARPRQEEYG